LRPARKSNGGNDNVRRVIIPLYPKAALAALNEELA